MLKIENIEVTGWEAAIRGMRNPMNSWEKSDSIFTDGNGNYHTVCDIRSIRTNPLNGTNDSIIGENDLALMKKLVKGGPVHAKFRRMINVTMDIIAPLYWWKEFDTYKVGTVANSCSTMHKIQAKEFTREDFSFEHFDDLDGVNGQPFREDTLTKVDVKWAADVLLMTLNKARELYLQTNDKRYWWQMIQLLPSSYNQRRTVQLNYEVLSHIYHDRKDHKLDEWHTFCDMIRERPYAKEIITMEA